MTIIKIATPKVMPINEKIVIMLINPSFFFVFKNLKVTFFSNDEINLLNLF